MKITLIDDDAMMRTMLEDFLKDKYPDAEVSSWPNGEEAMQHISGVPDLVILDYTLDAEKRDSLNGIEIFKLLRSRFSDVPVVFISGQEASRVAASTMMHGAHDYIIKNENVFMRLEETLKSIFGKNGSSKESAFKKNSLLWMLIISLIMLAGILAVRIIF